MSDTSTGGNAEQARYWSEEGGPAWVRDEAVYDLMLAPFNDALVARLDPQPGERVLDACAAPGAKATAIAERVGDAGQVIALDRNERRLGLVARDAARLGLDNLRVLRADASAAAEPAPAVASSDSCHSTDSVSSRSVETLGSEVRRNASVLPPQVWPRTQITGRRGAASTAAAIRGA